MTRAERRRALKEERRAKETTYALTKEQLDILIQNHVKKDLDKARTEATEQAINTAMVLLFTIPLEVLMDHYWPKSYAQRIPEFTNYIIEYYQKWQGGELDMDKMKEDLWEFGGVRLEETH